MPNPFDLAAPFYDRFVGRPEVGPLQNLLNLPAAGIILESGGGTGRRACLLRGQARQVVVADLSMAMLRAAQRRGGLGLVQCRAERLPFAAEAFVRVLIADALHHFGDQLQALKEAVRVLEPGGRLVIEEPDTRRPVGKLIALGEWFLRMHSRFLMLEELTAWITRQGLRFAVDRNQNLSIRIAVDK